MSSSERDARKERQATINVKRLSSPSPAQVQNFRKVFELYDTDNNGVIDITELEQMVTNLQKRKPTKTELERMMKEVDLNNDGHIDFSEFCFLMTRMLEDDDPEQEIRRVFDHFDVKGRGSINKKEIGEMFKLLGIGLSQSELDDVFELLDLNGDGVIDYKEFRQGYIQYSLKGVVDI